MILGIGAMTIVESVIAQFDRMMGPEGGALRLIDASESKVRVRYSRGQSECTTCVMEPDDLRDMIAEILAERAPGMGEVEIVTL